LIKPLEDEKIEAIDSEERKEDGEKSAQKHGRSKCFIENRDEEGIERKLRFHVSSRIAPPIHPGIEKMIPTLEIIPGQSGCIRLPPGAHPDQRRIDLIDPQEKSQHQDDEYGPVPGRTDRPSHFMGCLIIDHIQLQSSARISRTILINPL